jgi:hypothetical protein
VFTPAATSGYALGIWVIAGISPVVASIALVRGQELEQPAPAVALCYWRTVRSSLR